MLLSIIIKALNEEHHIERAIESALAAVAEVSGDGEVILADSASTDQTVALAQKYAIRIVQLIDPLDRSCGVGAQIGYMHARGEFVYILDGDMQLCAGFVPAAIAVLRQRPDLGGVGGLVEEMVIANHAFAARAAKGDTSTAAEDVICLNMGGLYRRQAVVEVGYLTNPNLHAFEEFELGVRLKQAGWRLDRLPVAGVKHYGPTVSTIALLLRRWKTGYACGHGELWRSALFHPHFWLVVRSLRVYRVQMSSLLLWLSCLCTGLVLGWSLSQVLGLIVAAWLAVYLLLSITKRSFGHAGYSVLAWNLGILGFFRGLATRPRWQPGAVVACRVLQ